MSDHPRGSWRAIVNNERIIYVWSIEKHHAESEEFYRDFMERND